LKEVWDFSTARRAPCGKKIDENHLTAQVLESNRFALYVFQGKIRSPTGWDPASLLFAGATKQQANCEHRCYEHRRSKP